MALKRTIINTTKGFDMFSSNELLLFNSNTSFRTITGGIFSIFLFIVVMISFASNIKNTLTKTTIEYVTNINRQNDPQETILEFGKSRFSFYFLLTDMKQNIIDINSGPVRYFNFLVTQVKQVNQSYDSPRSFIMTQPCTNQHFKAFPQIDISTNPKMNRTRCPKLGQKLELRGQMTNYINVSAVQLLVTPCSYIPGQIPCANSTQVQLFFATYSNFQFWFVPVKTELNLDQVNYKSVSFDQRLISVFSKDISNTIVTYLAESDVTTDESFMPYQSIKNDQIFSLEKQFTIYSASRYSNSDYYTSVAILKSQNKYTYTRNVQKIATVFSYIGGLYGAITAALFFLKIYTEQAYHLQQIRQFFTFKNVKIEKYLKNYNIFYFFAENFYTLFKKMNFPKNWEINEQLQSYKQQMQKQLDVCIIIKRLINLQMMMTKVKQKLNDDMDCPQFTIDLVKKVMLQIEDEFNNESIKDQTMTELQKEIKKKRKFSSIRLSQDNIYKIKIQNIQTLNDCGRLNTDQIQQIDKKIAVQNNNKQNLAKNKIKKQRIAQNLCNYQEIS